MDQDIFDHIKSVATTLINEFVHITVDQLIAAFLHDIIEDADISFATIHNIFWPNVTRIVDAVTKKSDDYYLWPDENFYYKWLDKDWKRNILKQKRK